LKLRSRASETTVNGQSINVLLGQNSAEFHRLGKCCVKTCPLKSLKASGNQNFQHVAFSYNLTLFWTRISVKALCRSEKLSLRIKICVTWFSNNTTYLENCVVIGLCNILRVSVRECLENEWLVDEAFIVRNKGQCLVDLFCNFDTFSIHRPAQRLTLTSTARITSLD
jgi:hypothetical protein